MPQSQLTTVPKQQALFSKRLIWALDIQGVPHSPTIVQREYNRRSDQAPVTTHAARKWIMGEAIPTQDRIQVLAEWLNVSASWLRFGEEIGDKKSQDLTSQEWRLVQGFRLLTDKQQAAVLTMVLSIPSSRPGKSNGR